MRAILRRWQSRKNGATAGCSRESTTISVKRLRAEIEPVSARDFLRFLLALAAVDTEYAYGRTGCAQDHCRAA